MRKILAVSFFLSLTFVIPRYASAYSYTVYNGFFEHPALSTYGFQSLASGVYHRQDNKYVSGVMSTIFAENYGYAPVEGEDWTFKFYDSDANQLLGYISYTYSGGCLYYDVGYGPIGMGCLADPAGVYQFYFIGTFESQCLDTKQYHHIASHNNFEVPRNNFKPTQFQPREAIHTSDSLRSIKPIIPTSSNPSPTPEKTIISVIVRDDIGCEKPVENVPLEVKNTIVSQSGSHKHFSSETEIGTGKYTNSNPVILSSSASSTVITSTTDVDGEFFAEYEAGLFGVKEKVTVIVTNPETNDKIDTINYLDIKIPSLTALNNAGTLYTVKGSYGNDCDKGHNDSSTQRRSHYLTSDTLVRVEAIAGEYLTKTDGRLSFNDASLAYGGVFDDGVNSQRNSTCHVSHRKGIDIDVNSVDFDNRNVRTHEITGVNGAKETLLSVLNGLVRQENGYKVKEKTSIHYRFY